MGCTIKIIPDSVPIHSKTSDRKIHLDMILAMGIDKQTINIGIISHI